MRNFVLALAAAAIMPAILTALACTKQGQPVVNAAVAPAPAPAADWQRICLTSIAYADHTQDWDWVRSTLVNAAATDAHCREAANLPSIATDKARARAKRLAVDILQGR